MGCYWNSCCRKEINNKHSQTVKRMYTTSVLLITTLLVNGLHELQVLRKARVIASQQQQSLRCCFNVLKNSFKMTDRLQPASLQMCSECPRKCKHYWYLRIFKSMLSLGYTVPNQLPQNCEGKGMFRFAVTRLMVKPFCHRPPLSFTAVNCKHTKKIILCRLIFQE